VTRSRKRSTRLASPARSAVTREPAVAAPCPIVGMGASAGGLHAFQRFFAHLPPTNGMAFVIVQHLDPRNPTLLPELLSKSTSLRVELAEDGTPLQADHVYVIPGNATLTLESGKLRVHPAGGTAPRMPIDTLFHSLAADQGHTAVCILFSGSGSDGTLGLRGVKEHGGMVMAQTPDSAQHDPMLRSAIATGLVDHVLPPEQLAEKLLEYATYLRGLTLPQDKATSITPDEFREIYALVRRNSGHDFSRYKTGTLSRRILRHMQVLQLASVSQYIDRLRQDGAEVDRLFRDLLIGVTHFFRDPEAWQSLATEVIPRLVEYAVVAGELRIWIPGCATGEEAYSLAILLKEEMSLRDARPKVQIFAGDIDDEALAFARQARYPDGIAEHLTQARLARFFVKHKHGYQVAKEIREMVIFSAHDLIKDPPFSRLDLIISRNLLIYLETDLQRFVTNLFHYALRRGGYLFLGPSENVSGAADLFRTLDQKHRIYQRSEVLARPLDVVGITTVSPRSNAARPRELREPEPGQGELLTALQRVLLEQFTSPWVLINAEGQCLYFSNRTGKYLEPAGGVPSAFIVDMARTGLRLDLRAAIHKAVKTGEPVLHENVIVESSGEVQRIDLSVRPLPELGDQARLFLVVFQELGVPRSRAEAAAEGSVALKGDVIVQQLESELRSTKDHLQWTAEELETSNEELKSANEELLSTNEELQASNEELQTSKEELQSVNEELETINAELVKKVQELDAANSDMENLFNGTQIPTLFLDDQLRIKRFSGASTEVFRLIETDLGRPITDIHSRFSSDIVTDMKEVLRTLVPKVHQIVSEDGSNYLTRILPYRRPGNIVDGLVVTFQDITQLIQAQEQRARLAAIVESSHDAIVSGTFDGTITSWNAAATELFGYSEQEMIGRPMTLILPADRQTELEEAERKLVRGERALPYESMRRTKDGRHVDVLVATSPIRDGSGKIVGSASIFRDLTELKRGEGFREESLRKDQFLAVLSHELRGPLASLRICVQLLESRVTGGGRIREAVEMADRQLEHLASLVDQLLDASRIASGKFVLDRKVRDLVEIVRRSAEDQRPVLEAQGVELTLQLPGEPLWVKADALRISQIVVNLVGNAAKFSPGGGRATLTLDRDDEHQLAVLRVKDEGVGIEPDVISFVFQPFTRVDPGALEVGGLGLGLALVQALVEAHGGSVEAKSEGKGRGAELIVHLPLAKAPDVTGAASLEGTRAPSARRRILVVEDNRDTARSLGWSLEANGHEVVVVSDGKAALEAMQNSHPDVVLCDIGLPGGMDGHAVATAIRADGKYGAPHLVAVTGYGMPADRARALAAGFDRFFVKGGDPRALLDLIDQLPLQSGASS
jgi:two-component system, chemotaxis family, CheB/CheR fusion protein